MQNFEWVLAMELLFFSKIIKELILTKKLDALEQNPWILKKKGLHKMHE
jgi:hypothetical protein